MNKIFKKLNLKDQKRILVLNSPENFRVNMDEEKYEGVIVDDERMPSTIYDFALIFVTNTDEIGVSASMVVKSLIKENPTFWISFPKNSKEISFEKGWDVMSRINFTKKELVEIDDEWAAVRFLRN